MLGHELGHVRNRDTLIMAAVASIAGAISFLAQMAQWSIWFGGRSDEDEQGGGLTRLFSTHPPIEERVARLERMAGAYLGG